MIFNLRTYQSIIFFTDLPDWILIYFIKNNEDEYKCSLCEEIVKTDVVKTEPVQHIKTAHKEIYDLHKNYKKQQDPAGEFLVIGPLWHSKHISA